MKVRNGPRSRTVDRSIVSTVSIACSDVFLGNITVTSYVILGTVEQLSLGVGDSTASGNSSKHTDSEGQQFDCSQITYEKNVWKTWCTLNAYYMCKTCPTHT